MDTQSQPIQQQDREVLVTAMSYMLTTDIPASERPHFEKIYVMFSKTMALGNIEKRDIFPILLAFEEVTMLMEDGLYEDARREMGRELMKMQLSRSVGGFQTLFGQQGIQRTEHIERVLATQRRKSVAARVSEAFRRDKGEPHNFNVLEEQK